MKFYLVIYKNLQSDSKLKLRPFIVSYIECICFTETSGFIQNSHISPGLRFFNSSLTFLGFLYAISFGSPIPLRGGTGVLEIGIPVNRTRDGFHFQNLKTVNLDLEIKIKTVTRGSRDLTR